MKTVDLSTIEPAVHLRKAIADAASWVVKRPDQLEWFRQSLDACVAALTDARSALMSNEPTALDVAVRRVGQAYVGHLSAVQDDVQERISAAIAADVQPIRRLLPSGSPSDPRRQ